MVQLSAAANGESGIPPRPLLPPPPPPAWPQPQPQPERKKRSRKLLWILSILAVMLLGFTAVGVVKIVTVQQLTADYSALASDYNEQVSEFIRVDSALTGLVDDSGLMLSFADDLLAAAPEGFTEQDTRDQLVAHLDELDLALDGEPFETLAYESVDRQPAEGLSESELREEIDSVNDLADSIQTAIDERDELSSTLVTITDDVTIDASAMIQSAVTASEALLAAAPSASNGSRMDLEQALSALGPKAGKQDQSALDAMTAYVSAMQEVQQSNVAREAAKGHPDYANRMTIEDFARSLSGGVVLDLDWAPVVNGFGPGGQPGYGGTAQWWYAKPNYTLITLSENVATDWNSPQSVQDLVAHEVGHAISIKPSCTDAFNSAPINGEAETWATAWAIGMGFSGPGNGTWAYGAPTQEQIDATMSCR